MLTREEILKEIDLTPKELKDEFDNLMKDLPVEEFAESFKNDPLLEGIPAAAFAPLVQAVFEKILSEFLTEVKAFCDHWKNRVPSEQELSQMSEDARKQIVDDFLDGLEPLIESSRAKFEEGLKRREK